MTTRLLIFCLLLCLSSTLFSQQVVVNWNDARQTIDGFGASDAWFADEIMTHPDKDAMLDLLFKRDDGAGLSILRHRIPPQAEAWVDGATDLVSNDLDFGTVPVHGVRFVNVAIPSGATIEQAYIQFTAKDNLSAACQLTVNGQAADDASTFEATPKNISSRPLTMASVAWTVPPWKDGERTAGQQTPDLKAIVQEIINRDGWQSGAGLAFVIQNLTGKRSAYTFEGGLNRAPELVVQLNGGETISSKVAAGTDDAEESGASYITFGAQVTQEAFARGCEKVWAAAWTPPPAWKTNGQPNNGGFLKTAHYQDWANYLQAYRAEMEQRSGIPLYGISPQNEPGVKTWESCQWQGTQFRDFIKNHLGPTLHPNCRIIVPEETNWNDVPKTYNPIHEDPAARDFVDIVAGHVYGGDPNTSYNHYGKPVWETEWSYDTSAEDVSINNGLVWAQNFWKLLVNAEVSACHHWWLVNMHNDGKQQALIAASPNQTGFQVAKRLWTIGNFSKFVRPGWRRISATKTPMTNVFIAAFKNESSNEFALVAINNSNQTQNFTFRLDGFSTKSVMPHRTSASEDLRELTSIPADSAFTASLAPKCVTTFVGVADAEPMGVSSTSRQTAPRLFTLEGNYPNPFNPSTTIRYTLHADAQVRMEIFDLRGRKLETLLNMRQSAGVHQTSWQPIAKNCAATGVYVCKIDVRSGESEIVSNHKLTFIR